MIDDPNAWASICDKSGMKVASFVNLVTVYRNIKFQIYGDLLSNLRSAEKTSADLLHLRRFISNQIYCLLSRIKIAQQFTTTRYGAAPHINNLSSVIYIM